MITRIIWSCAWTSDSRHFLTASRDKRLVLWSADTGVKVDMISLEESVTAVASADRQLESGGYVVAAGLETGSVLILTWSTGHGWRQHSVVRGHHSTVTRLMFRPGTRHLTLASSSADTSVRILNINL